MGRRSLLFILSRVKFTLNVTMDTNLLETNTDNANLIKSGVDRSQLVNVSIF